ncbi:MAG TPA: hypothetical protein VN922_12790, partial [Bacteroidia bacterium]|nr:hypothetical protein [Bacteroidia bacterium]
EPSFKRSMQKTLRILKQVGDRSVIFGDDKTIEQFQKVANDKNGSFYNYKITSDFENIEELVTKEINADDLIFVVSARKQTVSHNFVVDNLQKDLIKNLEFQSFVVLYPEVLETAISNEFSDITSTPASENIEKLKGRLSGIFKK